jgi:mRNA-capping enzyme
VALHHVQVPMQGRGAVPEPELVNHLFWLFLNYTLEYPEKYIVMHCTHGFNRTGEAVDPICLLISWR